MGGVLMTTGGGWAIIRENFFNPFDLWISTGTKIRVQERPRIVLFSRRGIGFILRKKNQRICALHSPEHVLGRLDSSCRRASPSLRGTNNVLRKVHVNTAHVYVTMITDVARAIRGFCAWLPTLLQVDQLCPVCLHVSRSWTEFSPVAKALAI